MGRSKGIVDVEVGQGRQGAGKFGLVCGFTRVKTKVLEKQYLAVSQGIGSGHDGFANTVRGEGDAQSAEFGEPGSDWSQGERGYALSLGPAQMRYQYDPGTGGTQTLHRSQGRTQSGVVDDSPGFQGNIEIRAYENASPPDRIRTGPIAAQPIVQSCQFQGKGLGGFWGRPLGVAAAV